MRLDTLKLNVVLPPPFTLKYASASTSTAIRMIQSFRPGMLKGSSYLRAGRPNTCVSGVGNFQDVPTRQGWQDLNPRPTVLETAALPTELHPSERAERAHTLEQS